MSYCSEMAQFGRVSSRASSSFLEASNRLIKRLPNITLGKNLDTLTVILSLQSLGQANTS